MPHSKSKKIIVSIIAVMAAVSILSTAFVGFF